MFSCLDFLSKVLQPVNSHEFMLQFSEAWLGLLSQRGLSLAGRPTMSPCSPSEEAVLPAVSWHHALPVQSDQVG